MEKQLDLFCDLLTNYKRIVCYKRDMSKDSDDEFAKQFKTYPECFPIKLYSFLDEDYRNEGDEYKNLMEIFELKKIKEGLYEGKFYLFDSLADCDFSYWYISRFNYKWYLIQEDVYWLYGLNDYYYLLEMDK